MAYNHFTPQLVHCISWLLDTSVTTRKEDIKLKSIDSLMLQCLSRNIKCLKITQLIKFSAYHSSPKPESHYSLMHVDIYIKVLHYSWNITL